MDLAVPVEQNIDKPIGNEKTEMDVRDLKVQLQQSFRLVLELGPLLLPQARL